MEVLNEIRYGIWLFISLVALIGFFVNWWNSDEKNPHGAVLWGLMYLIAITSVHNRDAEKRAEAVLERLESTEHQKETPNDD